MDLTPCEHSIVKLRDCFTAGYTLPQYCIDNGIKKPLFVSEKKFELFLWEVYVQFYYDKRMTAQFCFIDAPMDRINSSVYGNINPLLISNISEINSSSFDAVVLLSEQKVNLTGKKIIHFFELEHSCCYKAYHEIPLLNFLQRNPQVKFVLTNCGIPKVSRDVVMQTAWDFGELKKALKNTKGPIKCFDKSYTNEDILKMVTAAKVITHLDGTTTLADDNHPLIQIKHGKRTTAYQPEHYKNKIYLFGVCHHYGTNAPYSKTIQSYLQKMLSEANLPYRVENEGQYFVGRNQDRFYNLNALDYAPDDIIIFFGPSPTKGIPFWDIRNVFDSTDYKEIYCIDFHVNELGYKLVAEKYFQFLTENNFFRDVELKYPSPPHAITDMVYLLGSSRAA